MRSSSMWIRNGIWSDDIMEEINDPTMEQISDGINRMCENISHITPVSCTFERNPTYDPTMREISLVHRDGKVTRITHSIKEGVKALVWTGQFDWSKGRYIWGAMDGESDVAVQCGADWNWLHLDRYDVVRMTIEHYA